MVESPKKLFPEKLPLTVSQLANTPDTVAHEVPKLADQPTSIILLVVPPAVPMPPTQVPAATEEALPFMATILPAVAPELPAISNESIHDPPVS